MTVHNAEFIFNFPLNTSLGAWVILFDTYFPRKLLVGLGKKLPCKCCNKFTWIVSHTGDYISAPWENLLHKGLICNGLIKNFEENGQNRGPSYWKNPLPSQWNWRRKTEVSSFTEIHYLQQHIWGEFCWENGSKMKWMWLKWWERRDIYNLPSFSNILFLVTIQEKDLRGGHSGTLKSVSFVGQEAALGGDHTHHFSLTIAQLVNPFQ